MTGPTDAALQAQLAELEGVELPALRTTWRERFGEPPEIESVAIFRRLLAWRMVGQSMGLQDEHVARVLRLATRRAAPADMRPGDVLMRNWQGVCHEVVVTEDGFLHRGRRYANLSQVARSITGVKWNGLRFFGLNSRTANATRV